MSRILLNSELPKPYMELGSRLNDMDFYLFHMMEDDEYSAKVYEDVTLQNAVTEVINERESTQQRRIQIFDNSAYEFFVRGESLDMAKFASTIVKLHPSHYLLPDTLMNKDKTIADTEKFIKEYPVHSEPIAVLQGNSIQDFLDCAMIYWNMGLHNIAIPFHNKFLHDLTSDSGLYWTVVDDFKCEYNVSELTDDMKYAVGRIMMVAYLESILKKFNHVHFLGSHCPFEVKFLQTLVNDWHSTVTMDTAYPVKLAAEGIDMGKEKMKPTCLIDDICELRDNEFAKRMVNNILLFHKWRKYGERGYISTIGN